MAHRIPRLDHWRRRPDLYGSVISLEGFGDPGEGVGRKASSAIVPFCGGLNPAILWVIHRAPKILGASDLGPVM